jgi:dipeptidyl aminopeptidase/acylaminoacyl peptidase
MRRSAGKNGCSKSSQLDPARVGILGWSHGGMIMPMNI